MPASSSSDERQSEGAVRAAVIRLARPDGDGSVVIERAAILAEGTPAAAIEAWVLSHGGKPEEVPVAATAGPGLYGERRQRTAIGAPRFPRRYVFPATALSAGQ